MRSSPVYTTVTPLVSLLVFLSAFMFFTVFFHLSRSSVYRNYTATIMCNVNRALSTQTPNDYFSTAGVKRAVLPAHIAEAYFCLESNGYKFKPSSESLPVYTTVAPPRFTFSLSVPYRVSTVFFHLSKCSVYRNYTAIITCNVNRALSYLHRLLTITFLTHVSSEHFYHHTSTEHVPYKDMYLSAHTVAVA